MFHGKQCPSCGRPVREVALFCLDCGARVDGPGDPGETFEMALPVAVGRGADLAADGGVNTTVPRLRVVEGIDQGKSFPLVHAETRVGRQGELGDIIIDDPYVSREHAIVRLSGDAFTIDDVASANGVRVNDVEVRSRRLRHGDLVEIGYTLLRFELPPGHST